MDRAYIVALAVIVVVVVASFVAIWASVMLFPLKPASEVTPPPFSTQTPQPTFSPIPTPTAQPTPTPIVIPTPAPALSPTPPSTSTAITIQHKGVTYNTLTDKYNFTDKPDSGNVWLVIDMTITNKGYTSFNTNPYYFTITINNIKYSYDSETYSYGKWETVDILNGGSYSGSLVFQVPSSATSFTLNYERYGVTYNIVYQ